LVYFSDEASVLALNSIPDSKQVGQIISLPRTKSRLGDMDVFVAFRVGLHTTWNSSGRDWIWYGGNIPHSEIVHWVISRT